MDRPLPNIRKRLREAGGERSPVDAFDGFSALDVVGDTGWAGLAIAVALVLIIVIFLPLLGVALELIALLLLFCSGIVGRVVLGRPWTAEAVNLDHGERSLALAVKGFRGAGRAAGELATVLAASGPPERLPGGERTTLPRPPN